MAIGGHKDIRVGPHLFMWSPMCNNLVSNLKIYLKDRENRPESNIRHILVIDTGMWDIRDRNVQVSQFFYFEASCFYRSF